MAVHHASLTLVRFLLSHLEHSAIPNMVTMELVESFKKTKKLMHLAEKKECASTGESPHEYLVRALRQSPHLKVSDDGACVLLNTRLCV